MSDPDMSYLPPAPPPPLMERCQSVFHGGISDDQLVTHYNDISAHNCSKFKSSQSVVQNLVSNLSMSYSENNEETPEEYTSSYVSFFKAVSPIIQVGPSCGLVALAMAGQLLTGCSIDSKSIMCTAVAQGYTRYGEMFSADNLLSLSSQFLPSCVGRLLIPEIERCEKMKLIIETLAHRGAVLVPYDRDANNEPCLQQGYRAHWVLLTGVLLVIKTSDLSKSGHVTYEMDSVIAQLRHATVQEQFNSDWMASISEKIFIYAVHGRSTRTCLWSLDELLDSNDQLIAMDPRRQTSSDGELTDYCLPPGGVYAGLCGKIILLSKPSII